MAQHLLEKVELDTRIGQSTSRRSCLDESGVLTSDNSCYKLCVQLDVARIRQHDNTICTRRIRLV